MPDNTYHVCKACGALVYRKPHYRYGDGAVDTDKNPIYLFSCARWWRSYNLRLSALRDQGKVSEINDCGCLDSEQSGA
jgi:hypothetical protein